jgi:cytochrome c oxidase assembly protein subunit 11
MTDPLPDNATETARRVRRLAWKLGLAALLMVGFGFAMVPVYRVVCLRTGLNGTTDRIDATQVSLRPIDPARLVTVEFVAATSANLPWDFQPDVRRIKVHPGQVVLATFHVRNLSDSDIVGQAVPSITPGEAAPHFHKIECFCFSRQPLAAGESKTMPVQFVVDADLPKEIGTLTLAYTFFNLPTIRASLATHHRGS